MLNCFVAQLLLMNNGIHFSTFPVSNTAEIQQICESQLSGEVRPSNTAVTPLHI